MKKIIIGNRNIGIGEPAYIIAELSGNHGGSLDRAIKMIEEAKQANADAVKIQVYRPDTITLNCNKKDFRIHTDNAWAAYGTLYELYQYAHTPWEWLSDLFEVAQKLGIELFGSVFDETSVDILEKYSVAAYKIASPEINDIPLLKKVATTNKPVILSTGIASLNEIAEAVSVLKNNGCEDIVLLKCSTAYPAPIQETNLKTIPNLQDTFNLPAGFSDHTLGIGAAIAAVSLGASVIEKHIKIDDELETVDSFFSLSIDEFKVMVQEVRNAEKALGSINYDLTPEVKTNRHGRRSLYISAPIKKGERFTKDNIKSVRPGYGMETKYMDIILGRHAACDLDIGDRVNWGVIK